MSAEDSLEPLITECPNCGTRFRVTETQLQVATGRVRCGACLTVFQGTDYLILDGELVSQDGQGDDLDAVLDELEAVGDIPDSALASPPGDESDAVESGQVDSEEALSVLADPALRKVQQALEKKVGEQKRAEQDLEEQESANQAAGDDNAGANPTADDPEELPPELMALEAQFLDELHGDAKGMPRQASNDEINAHESDDDFKPLFQVLPEGPVGEAEPDAAVALEEASEATTPPADDEAELDWVDDLVVPEWGGEATDSTQQEIVDEGTANEPADVESTAEPASVGVASAAQALQQETRQEETRQEETRQEESQESTPKPLQESAAKQAKVAEPKESAAAKTAPEPQPEVDPELAATFEDWRAPEPEAGRSLWMWALLALAAISLPVQIFWYQFDVWSKDLTLRPIYASACEWLGCELPVLTDLTQIRARDTVVRSHPDRDDALVVDALIVNTAPFQQGYPVIELVFTSIQGELVAGRRFQPHEYLAGEVAGSARLTPNTPVHVSIEIADPGPDAEGFSLRFR